MKIFKVSKKIQMLEKSGFNPVAAFFSFNSCKRFFKFIQDKRIASCQNISSNKYRLQMQDMMTKPQKKRNHNKMIPFLAFMFKRTYFFATDKTIVFV